VALFLQAETETSILLNDSSANGAKSLGVEQNDCKGVLSRDGGLGDSLCTTGPSMHCGWGASHHNVGLSNDILYNEIGDDVFLNGKVLSVPSKGTKVYKVFWDTSTLAIPVDESKLRVIVCRHEKGNVNALKRARILFDEEYPNGAPPPGVLSINSTRLRRKKSSSANCQRSNNPSIQQSVNFASNITPPNRSLTNLRMAPILNNASTHGPNSMEGNVRMQHIQQNDESDAEVYNPEEEKFGEDDLEDNIDRYLTLNHRLHGYITDDGYDPASKEEDGIYPELLTWSYEDLPPEGVKEDHYHYSDPGPCL